MSWNLLERFIESDHFNNDPSLSVAYLSRYADHVGIHYHLCSKLRQFSWNEIEFFLPQLCHLLISLDNESMALEEFIYDLCEESVNGALLTFWLFQTYLHDLAPNPTSNSFKTCRRIYNKVQRIVFGGAEPVKREKIKENVLPVSVLSSVILGAVAAPFLSWHAGPLAVAQARKPRPVEDDIISDAVQTQKLGRSHTTGGGSSRPRRQRPASTQNDAEGGQSTKPTSAHPPKSPKPRTPRTHHVSETPQILEPAQEPIEPIAKPQRLASGPRPSLLVLSKENRLSTSSLPDFRPPAESPPTTSPPATATVDSAPSPKLRRRYSQEARPLTPNAIPRHHKIRLLRSNYFRSETQFLSALEDISNRLVQVPRPARLSALRAELALIAQDLPAEVDIPVICPSTLEDGSAAKSRHHRIVRLNPAEATSLNSAERVPYLLMVEVLREDFDFDPDTEANQRLLAQLLAEKGTHKRRLFDITEAARLAPQIKLADTGPDSVLEPATGDLGTTSLIQDPSEVSVARVSAEIRTPIATRTPSLKIEPPRSSSGNNTLSSITATSTPRTSDAEISRTNSPSGLRKMTLPTSNRPQAADQPDFTALATHMRTAAQMLAQLESSSSKRPKSEVAAIKAKIIASMQTLEEQSFYMDESNNPTFDSIMANANSPVAPQDPTDLDDGLDTTTDPNLNTGAGVARMENDQKTGGVQRKGDRDDPSAATFGEEWTAKRERIRKSSPYGWMKNWDLVSVIVKTGADLRQEAFACQLIQVCTRIWEEASIPVWTKRMRILVTGESSGLIETITNGVSLHSLKRSLTLASIAAGTNPKKRIASLKDHFIQAFGDGDSETYDIAAHNFARSLAAYSMICYVLQLKDRHNGNILIDNVGHIIHIDFGFMLSNSPGSMGFEAAPFKLTQEYVDVLGGVDSPLFNEWKGLCKQAFQALRKEAERIVMLVELMGRESRMPCFASGVGQAVVSLRSRFVLERSREGAEGFVEEIVGKSLGSYYTRLYDTFQYRTQGIY